MIVLIQRVREARVMVGDACVGSIGPGVLALLAIEAGDSDAQVRRMVERVLGYRIFADDRNRMNRSLAEIGGGLLVVPQFTLAADTRSGARPSFAPAASPAEGERLFGRFVDCARARHGSVETGRFGADMQVHSVNDGPVTFWLQVPPGKAEHGPAH